MDTRPELGSEPGEVRASLTQGQGKRGLWGVRTPPEVPGSQGMSGAGWSSGQDRGAGPSPGGGHAQDEQRWPRKWCVCGGVSSWKPWGHMAQRGASRGYSEPDWDGGCQSLREKARLWHPGRPALAHLLAEVCLPCCPGCLLTVSAPPVSPSPGASPPDWSPGTCPRPWVLEPVFGGPCEDLAFDLREVGTLGRLGQGRDRNMGMGTIAPISLPRSTLSSFPSCSCEKHTHQSLKPPDPKHPCPGPRLLCPGT